MLVRACGFKSRPEYQNQSENESESEHTPLIFFHSHSVSHLKTIGMFDFQKLEVYKKAKGFHISCKKLIIEKKVDSYVRDQLGRASFSVPLNIAEGSGKFSKADRKNYFTTARASVFECVAILDILSDEEKITKIEFEVYQQNADELS